MRMRAHYRWVMLILAFLTAFTLHLTIFSYSPLVSEIISEMKLSHVEAGSAFSMCILTLALFRIPWGMLSDRMGFAWVMRIASITIGVFAFLRGFAISYDSLITFQLLLGTGLAAIMPCLPKLVTEWFHKERRGLATGIYVGGFPTGGIFAFTLTPYMLKLMGSWRDVFRLYGMWALVLAILWWILARENEKNRDQPKTSIEKNLIRALKVKETWLLTALSIVAMGNYDTLSTWLPYILQFKGVSSETAGLIALMLPLGFLLASPTIGVLSDWVGLRKPFILILGVVSGFVIFGVTSSSIPVLGIAALLSGFCTVGTLTLLLEIPTELPKMSGIEGSVVGVISSVGNLGPLLMPIMVGYIKDVTGSFTSAIIALSIIAEIAPAVGLMIKETGYRPK